MTVSQSRVTRAGDYAYRVSHHVPTGMPGMAPNVFLCVSHIVSAKILPKPLGVIDHTGHVFAFQSADLALYHGPRLFSS